MVSRNVYVSADDVELFDRAASLGGGLSSAVAAGLRLFVAEREREDLMGEMKTVEVEVQTDAVATVKSFVGRRLLRYEHGEGLRRTSYRVYATAKGQLAVYRRDDPDWRALTSADENNPIREDPSTWSAQWWASGEKTLSVFADTDAMRAILPDELIAAVEAALRAPEVEALDI
ncbi:EXLDI protein [Microbacterium gorillae]|uniref:EXLDI protein n=1 Tax=Microbacterium gorillae TaxID=1231063 RepID=UPI000694CAB5|nr:EXLDI protein [Microbacterium gorillae]